MPRFTEQPYDQVIRSEGIIQIVSQAVTAGLKNVGLKGAELADELYLTSAASVSASLPHAALHRNKTIYIKNNNASSTGRTITLDNVSVTAGNDEFFISDGYEWLKI